MNSMTQMIAPLPARYRAFQRWCCYPPPGNWTRGDAVPREMPATPLEGLERVFGQTFRQAIQDRTVVDVGCGHGWQALGCLHAGAERVIGVDTREMFDQARDQARRDGLLARLQLTTTPLPLLSFDSAWADVAYSLNAYEHIKYPLAILAETAWALKPGGRFFVTFNPPWWHPYGAHLRWMVKYPWPQVWCSERMLVAVRRRYLPDSTATTFAEAGLNQMTIRRFQRLIAGSAFRLESLHLTPIRPLPSWVSRTPLLCEALTSNVAAVLVRQEEGET